MQQAINKNVQKVTYIYKVSTDHHSGSLELQNRLLIAVCMSLVESLRLFQKDPPRLEKVCASI
jgi:hypothetical protein